MPLFPLRQRLAAALLLALSAAGPAAAEDRLRLVLDWFVNPDHGPIVVAQQEGYFRDAGLAVELIAPADPSAPTKMVASGQADLAVTYEPQLHLQIHEGLPLVRVGTLIDSPLNCLLVLEDGPVKSIADLKGRRIGYSVAGVEEALLTTILGSHGLGLDDVTLVNVNWSLSPALMSGQVDAVIGAFRNFELNQMALEAHPGRCFYPEQEGVPAYDELVYAADPARMNPDVIRRFLAATARGAAFIAAHPAESWTIFSASSPELKDALNERAWGDTLPHFARDPAALDAGRYAAYEAYLKSAGLIDAELPVSSLAVDLGRP